MGVLFSRWWVIVLLATLALSACSSADSEPAAASPTSQVELGTDAAEALTATSDVTDIGEEATEPSTPVLVTDHGVTDTVIRVGYSVDLSGPLSAIDALILDAHDAYFRGVNERGGIAGRRVEIVALDHASDLEAHIDNVAQLSEAGDGGVVVIGSVGGGELAVRAAPLLASADLAAMVRGSLPIGERGDARLMTVGATTCEDTIIGLAALVGETELEAPTMAIVTRRDSYGMSSAQAARRFAEQLGLEVVIDERVGDDNAELVKSLVADAPDLVWLAVSPRELAEVAAAVEQVQSEWRWAGAPQSYDASLLLTPAAPKLAQWYTHVASIDPLEQSDHQDRASDIRRALPEWTYADADSLAIGWQQAEIVHAALLEAAEAGDMRREAVAIDPERISKVDDTSPVTRTFSVDPLVATFDVALSTSGSTGLVEQALSNVLDLDVAALCG